MTHNQSLKKQNLSVGVVLLNWNGGDFTIPCIRSLFAGSVKPDRIVVVDNASEDGSPDRIADTFPEVTLIRNNTNEGFTGGNHKGIELLLKQSVDYVWILNNDTIVAQDCLNTLILTVQRHPEAAGASGKIYYDKPKDRLWYAGAIRHPLHCAPKHLTTPVLDERAVDGAIEVEFISGCCMFVPSRVFNQFGGFITSYVAYSEDSEWCWRITRMGGKFVYIPNAHLWHTLSASLRKNQGTAQTEHISAYAWYLMNRNHLWTVRKHSRGRISKLISLAVNSLIQLKNLMSFAVRGEYDLVRSSLIALNDGIFTDVPNDIVYWN